MNSIAPRAVPGVADKVSQRASALTGGAIESVAATMEKARGAKRR